MKPGDALVLLGTTIIVMVLGYEHWGAWSLIWMAVIYGVGWVVNIVARRRRE